MKKWTVEVGFAGRRSPYWDLNTTERTICFRIVHLPTRWVMSIHSDRGEAEIVAEALNRYCESKGEV